MYTTSQAAYLKAQIEDSYAHNLTDTEKLLQ